MALGVARYSTILQAGSKSSNTVPEFLDSPGLAAQSMASRSMLDTTEARRQNNPISKHFVTLGAKMSYHGLKMASFHLFGHPNCSVIIFCKNIFDPFLVPKQPIFKAFWDFRRVKMGHHRLKTCPCVLSTYPPITVGPHSKSAVDGPQGTSGMAPIPRVMRRVPSVGAAHDAPRDPQAPITPSIAVPAWCTELAPRVGRPSPTDNILQKQVGHTGPGDRVPQRNALEEP